MFMLLVWGKVLIGGWNKLTSSGILGKWNCLGACGKV